jgi:aspartate/methionine/tyrosine aminotransferase
MQSLNPLVLDTGSPPIPQVQEWGRAYSGRNGPLIDLCQAAPGYPPHPAMLEHLGRAVAQPASAKYGPILGDLPLREVYAAHLSALYSGNVKTEQVAITAGCNQAFFAALLTLVGRGGTVMLPTPWYYNHQMTCDMLGLDVRSLPCSADNGFVPDPEEAETLLDDRVRAIVLVTPNNPTGAVYPPETVARFHRLCQRRGIWLLLDETYRDFLPEGQSAPHDLLGRDDWSDTVVQLYSFSKAYALPGQRMGALAGSASLMPQLMKVLDCMHICANRVGQDALHWGIDALAGWRAANRAEMVRRAVAMRACFAAIPNWRIDALGAYFAYVRHPFAGTDAWKVVERLALDHGVLLLPATAFAGSGDHVRISFANIDVSGIDRLTQRLASVADSIAAPR